MKHIDSVHPSSLNYPPTPQQTRRTGFVFFFCRRNGNAGALFKSSAHKLKVNDNYPRSSSRFKIIFFGCKTRNAVNRGVKLSFYVTKKPTDILKNCYFNVRNYSYVFGIRQTIQRYKTYKKRSMLKLQAFYRCDANSPYGTYVTVHR